MVLIIAVAGIAAAALSVFNKAQRNHPEATERVVANVYQSTSVLGAIITFFVTLLNALRGVSSVIAPPTGKPPTPKMFGVTPAVDVTVV